MVTFSCAIMHAFVTCKMLNEQKNEHATGEWYLYSFYDFQPLITTFLEDFELTLIV
jgi:hypothetical protein